MVEVKATVRVGKDDFREAIENLSPPVRITLARDILETFVKNPRLGVGGFNRFDIVEAWKSLGGV
jgi:hypothetical protein